MAAVKKKKEKTPQKIPQKAVALTWEELLVEKALAMISETDRQISESAGRFEQKMREKNRQVNESAELYEQQMKKSSEQAGVEANDSDEDVEQETNENGETIKRKIKGSAKQAGQRMKRSAKTGVQSDSSYGYYESPTGNIDSTNLMRKFNELKFVFDKSYKDAVINDKKNNISVEIDLTLESGDKVMIVEIMSRPTTKDITGHIERMKKVRRYADLHGDKRKYLGAVSGTNFKNDEKLFAMKSGFYVIEQSGGNFIINAPEGVYFPKEW